MRKTCSNPASTNITVGTLRTCDLKGLRPSESVGQPEACKSGGTVNQGVVGSSPTSGAKTENHAPASVVFFVRDFALCQKESARTAAGRFERADSMDPNEAQ